MSLASLIATGTKVWLDGVEPENIRASRALGVTGATSNPTIVSQIVGTGHFDDRPGRRIVEEIEHKVDLIELERVLMDEGTSKFAEAHKALLRLIAGKP